MLTESEEIHLDRASGYPQLSVSHMIHPGHMTLIPVKRQWPVFSRRHSHTIYTVFFSLSLSSKGFCKIGPESARLLPPRSARPVLLVAALGAVSSRRLQSTNCRVTDNNTRESSARPPSLWCPSLDCQNSVLAHSAIAESSESQSRN